MNGGRSQRRGPCCSCVRRSVFAHDDNQQRKSFPRIVLVASEMSDQVNSGYHLLNFAIFVHANVTTNDRSNNVVITHCERTAPHQRDRWRRDYNEAFARATPSRFAHSRAPAIVGVAVVADAPSSSSDATTFVRQIAQCLDRRRVAITMFTCILERTMSHRAAADVAGRFVHAWHHVVVAAAPLIASSLAGARVCLVILQPLDTR
jgi:hypothetical protein